MNQPNYFKRDAAHRLAEQGFYIIALNGKQPIKGSKGSADASRDHNIIDNLWRDNPYRNIGICTGDEYDLAVVDIDRKRGIDGLNSLIDEYGNKATISNNGSFICRTPTGGMHIYSRTAGLDVCNAQSILPGVDIRGKGGYVVAPPSSIKLDGNWVSYRWFSKSEAVPNPTAAVEDLFLRTTSRNEKPLSTVNPSQPSAIVLGCFQQTFKQGERDNALFRMACSLRSNNVDKQQALELIKEAALACDPPFDCDVALAKVDWAYAHHKAGKSH